MRTRDEVAAGAKGAVIPPRPSPAPGLAAAPPSADTAVEVDARGLQCPGPIMRLRRELDKLPFGGRVRLAVSDPGFPADIEAWRHSTGNELVSVERNNGRFVATIVRRAAADMAPCPSPTAACRRKTMVVFSNDFDRVMAAFIIANGAASMGSQVTLFFTFWGLNVLRKDRPGPQRKGIMKRKHAAPLPQLIADARAAGVRLAACSMSMDIMGLRREELIDGVEIGGVAMYLNHAEEGNVNRFI